MTYGVFHGTLNLTELQRHRIICIMELPDKVVVELLLCSIDKGPQLSEVKVM